MAARGEVVVTAVVRLPLAHAFAAFTEDIDRWWRRTPDHPPDAVVRFERGDLVAVSADGARVLANVAAWEPPHRVELRWHGPHGRPGDTVRIEFEAQPEGTRVTVRHRRPGLDPADAAGGVLALWWAELLRAAATAHAP